MYSIQWTEPLPIMRSHMVLYEYLCWTFLLNLISSSTGGIGRLQGLFLFLAVAFDSLQVFPIFFSILFKVKYAMYFFAIPSFDVLVGSNQKHCCNFFLKSVLPISSSISMGCWLVLFQRVVIDIFSGQRMLRMFLRHRFIKVWV